VGSVARAIPGILFRLCIRFARPVFVAPLAQSAEFPRMGKTIVIVQSNYIPWRGYFDLINSADEIILYDDVQYTIRDWRNRNIIKTSKGPLWLTIPVKVKGKYSQKIKDTKIADRTWNQRHWASITHNYAKARYFREYKERFEDLYRRESEEFLSEINYRFIAAICGILGISTRISWSMDYELIGDKTERLVYLCQQAAATAYLSGTSAKAYLNEDLFRNKGIAVFYMDYSGYREYAQLYPPFLSEVSIIDLIFNEGPDATEYMKSFSYRKRHYSPGGYCLTKRSLAGSGPITPAPIQDPLPTITGRPTLLGCCIIGTSGWENEWLLSPINTRSEIVTFLPISMELVQEMSKFRPAWTSRLITIRESYLY
jgi:hypothetical protein